MNRCDNCIHFNENHAGLRLPTCNEFGFPLAKSNSTPGDVEASFIRIGSTCGSHVTGSADGVTARSARPTVGIPLPTLQNQVRAAMPTRSAPTSCGNCRYFVASGTVQDEFGFHVGMCSVKAELIPNRAMTSVAASCEYGDRGPNRTSTDGVMLDQRYDLTASVNVAAANGQKFTGFDAFHHSRTDPRDWVTELPVTDEEAELGVAAWRLVHDPKGNRAPIPMPIFDWMALGLTRDPRETYGDSKPWLYVDHGGILYTAAFMMMGGMKEGVPAVNRALTLIGEAGTGKTEFWCYFAYLMDLPFHRISLRPNTDAEEFFGAPALVIDPVSGEQVTSFRPGRFSKVYQEPGVICLDEPNAAPDSIWFLLRPALDSSGQLVNEAEDWIIERHSLCFIGLAMNPAWNPSYRGTRPLSAADSDRLAKRWVDLPDPETERAILRGQCESLGYTIPEMTLTKMMNIAGELRQMYREGGTTTPWGIRPQVAVAQYTWGFELEDAFRLAVLDELEPEAAEVILAVVRSHA